MVQNNTKRRKRMIRELDRFGYRVRKKTSFTPQHLLDATENQFQRAWFREGWMSDVETHGIILRQRTMKNGKRVRDQEYMWYCALLKMIRLTENIGDEGKSELLFFLVCRKDRAYAIKCGVHNVGVNAGIV